MDRSKKWRGLTSVCLWLLILMVSAASCGLQYAYYVNDALGIEMKTIVTPDSGTDTVYYKSEFGDLNAVNQEKLVEATRKQTITEEEEGAVLLRNEKNTLPLAENERSVSFFGHAIIDPVYRCGSSGNMPSEPNMISVLSAFEAENFQINPALLSAYRNSSVKRKCSATDMDIGEDPVSLYSDSIRASWEKDYNDVAFIFLARESAEGTDFLMQDKEGISQLALHQNERDMIELVMAYRRAGVFGKVVVLLNTPTPMECGWLEEYGIDACLWIGNPGQWGAEGVANLIVGKANPSGRLVDTYAANSLSAPACVNSGTNTPTFANADEVRRVNTGTKYTGEYVSVQVEGIYVGYKYYETRYEDSVLGRGGAASPVGSLDGEAWNYEKEVLYPFGYGLSYTSFKQVLESVEYREETDSYTVVVNVTNIGRIAGKSVVQIYAQTPYGEYERQNLVEKSAVQLVGFAKTALLASDESERVEITVDRYLLASYDYIGAKGYILSAGDYYLAVGSDCHDALNNILAAKGVQDVGNRENTYVWTQETLDAESYRKSSTGEVVTNQFDDCNLNSFTKGAVTYLSRQDWEGTYPVDQTIPAATEEMLRLIGGDTYQKPSDAPKARDIPQGVDAGIQLLDMVGVPWEDTRWETYLSQMTLEELATQPIDAFGTASVTSVVKNQTKAGDGIDSVAGKLPYGDKPAACCYTTRVVLASTWNLALHARRSELMGEEMLYMGCYLSYSAGGNLHRTPFGGRNFEYLSEDSVFGYLSIIPEMKAASAKGTILAVKHLAANDQEYMRAGVNTMFNEQGFREGALRVFEGAIRVGKTLGLMQSYNRIGCTWSSACSALCTQVVRNEWGFCGVEVTDAATLVDYTGRYEASFTAGTDIFCLDSKKQSGPSLVKRLMRDDDGYLLSALRRAVKANHYAYVNSCAINGMSPDSYIVKAVPWWQIAAFVVIGILSLAETGCAVMLAVCARRTARKQEG